MLDTARVPICIVEGIVSIDAYDVAIEGKANHAGTTPMALRHDALLAAARLIEAVNQTVVAMPGRQVGTVGRLMVSPGARNVIPGHVAMTIELRDLSPDKLDVLGTAIGECARKIAADTHTTIALARVQHVAPAVADPALQAQIEASARARGLATMRLPSGAGHDAQNLAAIGPMAMIFVPSIGGISHSPAERTDWRDCAQGADVLLDTLLAIDAR